MPTVEYLNYEILDDYGWSIDDDNLFEKAREANLTAEDHGRVNVEYDEFVLDAAEDHGLQWPYSCRTASCANCAAIVTEGELDMDLQMILSDEEVKEKNVRLTCVATPGSEKVRIIYNAKHIDYLRTRVV